MMKAALSVAVAALILIHLTNSNAAIQKRDLLDVAAAKYDSSGGGGGSSYGGSSGGGSYGGGGYSSGGGGGSSGGYGSAGYGSSGGGGGSYGGSSSGGYGGSSGGGGSYGGSGGGGGSYGGSGGGGGGYGGGGSYGGSSGGGAYGSSDGGGGDSGGGDIGNVYYYYYPTSEYSSSPGSYSNKSPSGSYYGMMGGGGGGKDKDKEGEVGIISSLINLSIPAVLAVVLGIPLAILLIGGLLALGAFVIGRSNNGGAAAGLAGLPVIGGLVDLNLVKSVHEAFAAYQALSTDENCRQRVVCELGYILKSSDKRATVVSVLDAMLPTYMQKHFKPLKEVMTSGGESGKCEKYVCNAAAAAMKAGPFKNIFGSANKTGASGGTKTPEPTSESEKIEQSSSNSTEQLATNNDALM